MGGIFGGGGAQSTSTVDPVAAGMRIQTSSYGAVIPLVYGKTRVSGNLIWYGDFTPISHTTTTSSGGGGGKGGGGGGSSSHTSYTYTTSFMLALCEGPIAGVESWWADKNYMAGAAPFTIFQGSYPQSPWAYMAGGHAGEQLAYPGIAYAAAGAYDLGGNTSLPNHSFEVAGHLQFGGGIVDASPKDILLDYVTNPHYGAIPGWNKFGDLTAYSNYCVANGLFLSPAWKEQVAANQAITHLLEITNSAPYFSEGLLKVVPYGDSAITGNGVTYTPNLTPIYDLTDDDFIADSGQDPVHQSRNSTADAFNQLQVEFVNRANEYNTEPAEAKDQANIETFGLRSKQPITAHEIADAAVARKVAQLILQRCLYVRNSYEFQLGWKYCLLEPTDIVTLTDPGLSLNKTPVRITSIEENEFGLLTVQAEDAPPGVYSSAIYSHQEVGGFSVNFNQGAGGSNPPVIFEAPDTLTTSGLEIWIGTSGGPLWGGAQVWASQDGATYRQVGAITNPARQGTLMAALPNGADPDVTDVLAVDMSMSRGALASGTKADADTLATLCVIGTELVSYQTATLTAANKYNLSYLRRGAYGTQAASHAAGSPFSRVDAAFFRLPFTADQIGQKFYIKLPSVNVFGGGVQGLADVDPIVYTPTGAALQSPLPNLTGVGTNFVAGLLQIYWDASTDFRQPNVDYEIRVGASWESASIIGRTPLTNYTVPSNGTYWIAAHYMTNRGVNAYSVTPSEVIVAGASLVRNVVATWDEVATNWPGTLAGLTQVGSELMLVPAGDVLGVPDFLGLGDVLWYGGVAAAGSYTLPAGHAVDISRIAPCQVTMTYTARAQSIYDNVLTINDFLAYQDLFGSTLGQKIGIQAQIAVAGDDGIYGSWLNYQPGIYNARHFKARLLVATSDPQVTAFISGLSFTVDVPDRIDPYQITTSATAAFPLTYSAPFNGGAGLSSLPLTQATVLNAQAGDDVRISSPSLSGCSIEVYNGGVRVVRTVNVQVQGY